MRLSRFLPVIAAGALVAATVAPASAATPGVGSTDGSLTVLGIDAGGLLNLDVLSDEGIAKTVDAASASALLDALHVTSPTLGLDQSVPLLQASSTDGEDSASNPATDVPDNQVVGGQLLPASLRALVGADGATSTIGAGLADLDVLSGVLGIDSTTLALDARSVTDQAGGTRTVSIDQISVLDLSSLLAGLGIPVTDLPLDSVLGIIDGLGLLPQLGAALNQLGLPVDLDLTTLSTDSVLGLVDQLEALPDAVTTLTGGGSGASAVCDVVGPVLGGLLGSDATTVCTDIPATVDQITAQLPDVQGTVDGLLGQTLDTILGALDGATLLSLDGLDVSMVTTATDSIETSVADVTATLGDLTVGAVDLGALDLQGAASQVSGVVQTVQSTLGGILGQIDPALADLITVHLLEQASSVTEDAGTITSDASFDGLGIDIAAIDLGAILGRLGQQTSIGDQLLGVGVDPTTVLPVPAIAGLNDALTAAGGGGDVFALADGASVRLASLSQTSSFSPQSVATPQTPGTPSSPTLPRTGSNDTVLVLVAAVFAVGALGLRRMLRAGR